MSIADKIEDQYEELVETLTEQRDELKVQMHLASMDARDEWEELEKKWEHLRSKGKQIKAQVDVSAQDIGSAISLLGEEIKHGYNNIKKSFKS